MGMFEVSVYYEEGLNELFADLGAQMGLRPKHIEIVCQWDKDKARRRFRRVHKEQQKIAPLTGGREPCLEKLCANPGNHRALADYFVRVRSFEILISRMIGGVVGYKIPFLLAHKFAVDNVGAAQVCINVGFRMLKAEATCSLEPAVCRKCGEISLFSPKRCSREYCTGELGKEDVVRSEELERVILGSRIFREAEQVVMEKKQFDCLSLRDSGRVNSVVGDMDLDVDVGARLKENMA